MDTAAPSQPPLSSVEYSRILSAIRAVGEHVAELSSPEAVVNLGPVLSQLGGVASDVGEIKDELKALNGTVRSHTTDLTVLKIFCDEQVKPALVRVVDLRIELAKLAAVGGGFGLIATLAAGIGKAAGVW